MKKEPQIISLPTVPKVQNPNPSPIINTPKVSQLQISKMNDIKSPTHNQGKSLEMATRVVPSNPNKQQTSRPTSTESITASQVNFCLKIYSF